MSEPYSGHCHLCGAEIIEARVEYARGRSWIMVEPGRVVILDPAPHPDGTWRARVSTLGVWVASQADPDDKYRSLAFRGSKRREHECDAFQLTFDDAENL